LVIHRIGVCSTASHDSGRFVGQLFLDEREFLGFPQSVFVFRPLGVRVRLGEFASLVARLFFVLAFRLSLAKPFSRQQKSAQRRAPHQCVPQSAPAS
jgi:hypothetical protein